MKNSSNHLDNKHKAGIAIGGRRIVQIVKDGNTILALDNMSIPYIWDKEHEAWDPLVEEIEPICFCMLVSYLRKDA